MCALIRSMGLPTASFASGEEFIARYKQDRPGCLITDVRMLGMSGLELQDALKQRGITLPVIVITAHARTRLTVRAMKQGAVTLLEKPYEDDDLWDAVREALKLDEQLRHNHKRREEQRRRLATLTDKEREVLDEILAGHPNKVIARQLDVSLRTVENRRQKVFAKMQANSVAELVQFVMEANATD